MAGKAAIAAFAACMAITASSTAATAEQIKIKSTTYGISGSNGIELYMSMQRRGPRHGFLSRAIAQTSYMVEWEAEVRAVGSTCHVVSATPKLDMTYTYPQPSGNLSPQVRKRWQRFMVGVKKHEERHGSLARQMVRAAEASVKGLRTQNDGSCRRTRAEIKRRANAVYATYEARQRSFDAQEHKDRGNIERLIRRLVEN